MYILKEYIQIHTYKILEFFSLKKNLPLFQERYAIKVHSRTSGSWLAPYPKAEGVPRPIQICKCRLCSLWLYKWKLLRISPVLKIQRISGGSSLFLAVLLTRREKGPFLSRRSVLFWYLRISIKALVPGRNLLFLGVTGGCSGKQIQCLSVCWDGRTVKLSSKGMKTLLDKQVKYSTPPNSRRNMFCARVITYGAFCLVFQILLVLSFDKCSDLFMWLDIIISSNVSPGTSVTHLKLRSALETGVLNRRSLGPVVGGDVEGFLPFGGWQMNHDAWPPTQVSSTRGKTPQQRSDCDRLRTLHALSIRKQTFKSSLYRRCKLFVPFILLIWKIQTPMMI